MCSEFGNWGLPYPKDLRDASGQEPWWFETGHDWGEGVMYAHGVENRFSDWSLDRVFGDLRRFVIAAQWQQFRALKYEIEAMRRKPSLAGYVITELHDCHWESNGLLDMKRNPRVFHELLLARQLTRQGEAPARRVRDPGQRRGRDPVQPRQIGEQPAGEPRPQPADPGEPHDDREADPARESGQ